MQAPGITTTKASNQTLGKNGKRLLSKLSNTTYRPKPNPPASSTSSFKILLIPAAGQCASANLAQGIMIHPALSSCRTATASKTSVASTYQRLPSEGRMRGLFASLYSPEKLRATTELLLNRHSARKSVPVSSCLFSGLAVMDYIQPQVGHKPAVYLSFPNILLQFLYYRGANASFQDASCIKSTYFSEYFTVI